MNVPFDQLHPVELPHNKLARLGPEALSDKDLLAVVLGGGRATSRSLEEANRIVAEPTGMKAFAQASVVRDSGLGGRSRAVLAACLELGHRVSGRDSRPMIDSPQSVLGLLPLEIRTSRKEHFVAFYLNARSQLLARETVSVGTLSSSLIHPREALAPALEHRAAAWLCLHNHPSGDCTPSMEDKDATRRLIRSSELLGVPLLDHMIVSESGFFSFKEHGLMS